MTDYKPEQKEVQGHLLDRLVGLLGLNFSNETERMSVYYKGWLAFLVAIPVWIALKLLQEMPKTMEVVDTLLLEGAELPLGGTSIAMQAFVVLTPLIWCSLCLAFFMRKEYVSISFVWCIFLGVDPISSLGMLFSTVQQLDSFFSISLLLSVIALYLNWLIVRGLIALQLQKQLYSSQGSEILKRLQGNSGRFWLNFYSYNNKKSLKNNEASQEVEPKGVLAFLFPKRYFSSSLNQNKELFIRRGKVVAWVSLILLLLTVSSIWFFFSAESMSSVYLFYISSFAVPFVLIKIVELLVLHYKNKPLGSYFLMNYHVTYIAYTVLLMVAFLISLVILGSAPSSRTFFLVAVSLLMGGVVVLLHAISLRAFQSLMWGDSHAETCTQGKQESADNVT